MIVGSLSVAVEPPDKTEDRCLNLCDVAQSARLDAYYI